ncbi:uncharacterized protein LOC119385915 [Rhipicephalus sanguineus]|uniref:uncharacterized protein LOC119385915 n=1 Tax=Rhipicephalus sanguineus TaxID=34632 RepID=UPI0020C2674F|nr:uncharacterized protein LOC119385915 [Rhipicephalus sanguineus]
MAERDQWGSKCTFLLSLIGMSVGMGNVWRFPYVVYVNGGGAFIIPYITLTLVAGRPMYLLELVLGQFSGYAQTKAFDGYPIAKGVGWAMVYASVSLALFNSMVLAYVIIYLYYSMGNPTTLPWMQCDPSWADEQCYVKKEGIPLAVLRVCLRPQWHQVTGKGHLHNHHAAVRATAHHTLSSARVARSVCGAQVLHRAQVERSSVGHALGQSRRASDPVARPGLRHRHLLCWLRQDSEQAHKCATVQAVLSPVRDEFTPTLRPRRWVLAASGCLALMFFGLPMTRQDGIFTLKMFNAYFGDLLLPMLALFETCFVVYGYGEYRRHPLTMGARRGICVTNIVFFEKLHIAGYDLPVWTTCVGITLVFIGLAIVVAFCVYHLYICEWDYDAALAINEDWGPRDPDEHLRYLAFLKSQGTEAAAEGQSEDTTTDARSQGQSSGEEGQSGIQAAVVVAVEDAPPEITAVLSDSPAMPTAPGVPSEGGAQRSGSDRNAGLTRTLVISESGVTVVTNPLSDGEEMPPKAASVS